MLEGLARRYRRDGITGVVRSIAGKFLPDKPPLDAVFRELLTQSSVCIVQIGAYVGNTFNDPLWKFFTDIQGRTAPTLKAILVEPDRENFRQLKTNCAGMRGVVCENAAIADSTGEREFYRLDVDPKEHGMPEWLHQLGSLKEERMTTLWDGFEADQEIKEFYLKHRVVDRVNCITPADLFARHGITEIDLLQIDTEGFEYEILKAMDFTRWKPRFINLERTLLQHNEDACFNMLRREGYRFVDHDADTLCTLRR